MQTIEIEHSGPVATVWLNRPDMRNAFNETSIAEITQAFRDLGAQAGVRVIVLAARGPAFCAGADLNWMKKMAGYTHEENLADAAQLADMLRTIYACPKPVVAKVQGDCYAGGMGLVAACDIAVAADSAGFCLSEVKLGLIPATISPYVIKAMGESAARRYFITAERFTAQEAQRIGFVHALAGAADLDAVTSDIVKAIANNSPNAVKEAKRLVQDVAGRPLTLELIADTAGRIADIRSSEEGKEGVRSFLEKRKPDWLQQP
ncbi:enoyl-CoA hydratase/isomerase family protein [Noviherbaspirillum galbum]|uniref:Enoyl-CoA hydratase/isomerase family protein n=1 Tax=Noviherbaspirillum galbum TaxID=2709383 RepID=A0A6B3SR52_9BURK|nr:enoyl-CoA hydratase/isomerase family protein [Noviherbaspirillum galbum]NEX63247.1 enoyl-CoA hydratase/isomerase family protein [Noviherbaspirillum galbum]